jgi:ribosomal protein L40E
MTMPKGWKEIDPFDASQSLMPEISLLSRPAVEANSLKIKGYKIKKSEQKDVNTGQIQSFPLVKYLQIFPIDSTYCLSLSDGVNFNKTALINMKNISDTKVTSITKGHFSKKEDLMIQISYTDMYDNRPYVLTLDVEDNVAHAIVQNILSEKKMESDSIFWTHRSLNITNQYGQQNRIDIYPYTPFLANEEIPLWWSLKHNANDKSKKITQVDVVTNYRILQYYYEGHKGESILFPTVHDIKIVNEMRGTGFGEYNPSSPHLSGIQPSGVMGVFGNVVFYSSTSSITFTQVNDPQTLAKVVTSINRNNSNMRIGNGDSEQELTNEQVIEVVKHPESIEEQVESNIPCQKCNNMSNPPGSKFCNNCGSSLNPTCPKCGNSNPADASFCGHCGSKMI